MTNVQSNIQYNNNNNNIFPFQQNTADIVISVTSHMVATVSQVIIQAFILNLLFDLSL